MLICWGYECKWFVVDVEAKEAQEEEVKGEDYKERVEEKDREYYEECE